MSQSWWQRMSSTERKIAIILPILLVCTIIAVVIAVVSKQSKQNIPETKNDKLKKTADLIQASMDVSIDPCDDFYKFTCGKFNTQYKDIDTANKFNFLQFEVYQKLKDALDKKASQHNSPPQQKLLDAYSSCFRTSDVATLTRELWNLLNDVGGWPMGDSTWNENKYDIDVAIADVIKTTGMTPLVGFAVLPDNENTTRNIITLAAPTALDSGLNAFSSYLKSVAMTSQTFVSGIFNNDMYDIISLEKDLTKIILESKEEGRQYHRLQIKKLNTVIKGVDFMQFFQVITNTSLNNMDQYLTEDDYVNVFNLQYLQKLAQLVQSPKFSMRVYANYIGARIILESSMLVLSVVGTGYSYPKQNLVYSRAPSNWQACLSILSARLNHVTDRVYVEYIGDSGKGTEKGMKMIDHIRQSFETLARDSDWLDNDTLSVAIQKLHAMREFIGYPNWIMDDKKLEDYYNTLPNMGTYFGANLKKISGFMMDKMLIKLRKINDLNEWPRIEGITTTMVNAFYMLPFNAICFPLAIQSYPFYDPDLPWYLNFGAIGTVIGHEITHGFDSEGRTRDENGNVFNWWSQKDSESFNQKAECFVQQYNNYYDSQSSLPVNGTLTLPENIADNGGLRQAYLAYQMWEKEFGKENPLPGFEKYTPQQLLFISYGSLWCAKYETSILQTVLKTDTHTPSPYRVWGTIMNSKEFAETFNCSAGTKMNPKNKCIIW